MGPSPFERDEDDRRSSVERKRDSVDGRDVGASLSADLEAINERKYVSASLHMTRIP